MIVHQNCSKFIFVKGK